MPINSANLPLREFLAILPKTAGELRQNWTMDQQNLAMRQEILMKTQISKSKNKFNNKHQSTNKPTPVTMKKN